MSLQEYNALFAEINARIARVQPLDALFDRYSGPTDPDDECPFDEDDEEDDSDDESEDEEDDDDEAAILHRRKA